MKADGKRCAVTDREKLHLAIRFTTEFEFGQVCDVINDFPGLTDQQKKMLQSKIRTRGNNVIRVVGNHLDAYNVTRKHTSPVDANGIANRLQQEGLKS